VTRRGRIAAATLALGFGVPAVAPRSQAADRPSVLLIAAGDDPTGSRVAAELHALGFDVVEVAPSPAARGDSEVDLSARSARTIAAVAIRTTDGQVRVWTVAPGPDGLVLRATIDNDADPAIVALRTVEALRTSVTDIHPLAPVLPPPSPPRPVPPAGIDEGPARAPSVIDDRWGASIAPSFSVSPGDPEASWHAQAILHWLWGSHGGVEGIGVVPLSGTRWTESEGSAYVTYRLVAGGLRWEPFAAGRQTGDAGAGVGAILVHVEGSGGPGFVGSTTDTAVAAPYVRLGYGIVLVPWLRVRADLAAFFALPRPVLTFAGRDGGSWGEPLLSGSIGVEVVSR
jgi:hypothetical protein